MPTNRSVGTGPRGIRKGRWSFDAGCGATHHTGKSKRGHPDAASPYFGMASTFTYTASMAARRAKWKHSSVGSSG